MHEGCMHFAHHEASFKAPCLGLEAGSTELAWGAMKLVGQLLQLLLLEVWQSPLHADCCSMSYGKE